eukprot:jgi/Galph1/4927/GphlegSOOS_G3519.1
MHQRFSLVCLLNWQPTLTTSTFIVSNFPSCWRGLSHRSVVRSYYSNYSKFLGSCFVKQTTLSSHCKKALKEATRRQNSWYRKQSLSMTSMNHTPKEATYDYDLIVIGGGSGGVRASRMSANYGAKVAVIEKAALGGTCVNVGCVPKKLFVYSSHFSSDFEDSKSYGWDVEVKGFHWKRLIENKNKEIERLNGVYEKLLTNAGVNLIRGSAHICDAHSVQVDGKRFTCKYMLIAAGSWPTVPDIPGKEHAITSNECFYLETLPQKIIIVGGGYIATEFACIFHGLGVHVTQIYRGPLFLAHFDKDVREFLADQMKLSGVDLRFNLNVVRIEKNSDGTFTCTLTDGSVLKGDKVMFATGRHPRIEGLGVENAGVKLGEKNEIIVDEYSKTNVDNIYAIGDITNRVQLTPVAIAEGVCFADTVFGGNKRSPCYEAIPTAVFSNPTIGTVGLTEEQAREKYNNEIDIYKTSFRPLKHTLTQQEERIFYKLIVHRQTRKVVGAHLVSPEAGELAQVLGVCIKAGATKEHFDATIGVHPTSAEELVTLRTKEPDQVPTWWTFRMKPDEWVKCLEPLLEKDDIPNKSFSSIPLASCLVSLNTEYYLLLLPQNVSYLIHRKRELAPRVYKVHWNSSLRFEAEGICVNRDGSFGALIGKKGVACFAIELHSLQWKLRNEQVVLDVFEIGRNETGNGILDLRSDLTIACVGWHPTSSSHLCVLTSDSSLWLWNILDDIEEEEQRVILQLPNHTSAVSFSFGTGGGWQVFTVYIAGSDGALYALCPFYPFGGFISSSIVSSLLYRIKKRLAMLSHEQQSADITTVSRKLEFGASISTSPLQDALKQSLLGGSQDETWNEKEKNLKLQLVFLEECCRTTVPKQDNTSREPESQSHVNDATCCLERTLSTWIPMLQGPISIVKNPKDQFFSTTKYCLYCFSYDGIFPVILHSSGANMLRMYIPLTDIEPVFLSTKDTFNHQETSTVMSTIQLLLFENIQLTGRQDEETDIQNEEKVPMIIREFGQHVWRRESFYQKLQEESGPYLFLQTRFQLYMLKVPWLSLLSSSFLPTDEQEETKDIPLSRIQLLATTTCTSPNDSLTNNTLRGIAYYGDKESIGILVYAEPRQIRWIPLFHYQRREISWDNWGSLALEIDSLVKENELDKYSEPLALEKRCKEIFDSLSHPPVYIENRNISPANVDEQEGTRFLQQTISKYRETYISNFEKLSLILLDAIEKIPKGLDKLEKRFERIQVSLEESQQQLVSIEKKLSLCKQISKNLMDRVSIIREALIEGQERLSKGELEWKQKISRRLKELPHYEQRAKEVQNAVQQAVARHRKPRDTKNYFTREEIEHIQQCLSEHTLIIGKLFSNISKLEKET